MVGYEQTKIIYMHGSKSYFYIVKCTFIGDNRDTFNIILEYFRNRLLL